MVKIASPLFEREVEVTTCALERTYYLYNMKHDANANKEAQ